VSRLTDFQIKARIKQCESTAALHRADRKFKLAFLSQSRACAYRAELAARERGEAEQEPQEVRFGEA
jgi:hypothetical protein